MIDWVTIRNDYINGNISYRKLAEKHNVSWQTLRDRAVKEKWFDKKKEHQNKIQSRTEQKTVEKLAEKEANRILRISAAADKLLEKIEQATEQLDLYIERQKIKTPVKIKDNKSGKVLDAFQENEKLQVTQLDRIDRAGLKQIASALKDLKDIQFVKDEDKEQESPNINISISAATIDDTESDEE